VALSVALCSGLLLLIQAGLGYLSVRASSPWYWLAGTPLAFLLSAALGAFYALAGGRQARQRGARIGLLIGLGGAGAAALVGGLLALWALTSPYPPATTTSDRLGRALLPFVLFFLLIPGFVVLNLLSVLLATLGGMAGGYVRARFSSTGPPA
jgi:hypothetical protein